MKNLILTCLVLLGSITSALSGYEQFNSKQWIENRSRNFNDQWDRIDQRMQFQETNRIQRDILNEMQKQNRTGIYRYGR